MSFQILDIVLYSKSGERRVLALRPGKVNIITRASKTGKTALISIVDYCLGSGSCEVPEGIISQTVSWYGVRLQSAGGQIFVARAHPEPSKNSNESVFCVMGAELSPPDFPSLRQTTNTTGLESLLTEAAGITLNLHVPEHGQTRTPISATIRHALWFVFQQQDEIISRRHLFHKQSEPFIPQAIKDVLPYFLGAVPDDHIAKKEELRRLRSKLRDLQRRQNEIDSIRGDGASKAHALLMEAQGFGLAERSQSGSWEEVVEGLGLILANASNFTDFDVSSVSDAYNDLMEERSSLRNQAGRIKEELRAAKSLRNEEQGFSREAKEQAARLKSIDVLPGGRSDCCPMCKEPIKEKLPTVMA